jgi:hypothetical protein
MTELDQAIESLYAIFARYSRPEKNGFCPCGCTKPNATDHLVDVPLRELRFADLEDYSACAMTTQGTCEDFRYLLPRLFQGIAKEPYGYNPEILFSKLSYAKWMDWNKDEITSIRAYLHGFWRTALNSFPINDQIPVFFEIETPLSSISQTGEALEPYLQIWSETRSQQADEHLIQFVTFYGSDFSDGRTLHEAFWEKSKPQAGALRNWLLQPKTLQRIAGAAHLLRTDGYEHLFPRAFEILQNEGRVQSRP